MFAVTRATTRALLAAAVAVALVACDDDDGAAPTTTAAVATVAPTTAPATTTSAVPAPTTTTWTATGWSSVVPGGDCQCAQGGEFSYWVRKADPTRVVLFFQGGGACFSAETCDPVSGSYKTTTGPEDDPTLRPAGVFDFTNPRNPLRDWSMVFVPYCTGDVFLGYKTTQYSPTVTVDHVGAVNARTALAGLAQMFPDATELLVTGESAGGVPTPLLAGQAHDLLPAARIVTLADSSGAYPDVPAINALVGSLWGTVEALPSWPELAGVTVEQLSIPGLYVLAGTHDPSITFARHDYAFDATQAFFGGLAGFDASNLVQLIDQNEQKIEAAGVPLLSYVAPGSDHTVLGKPELYTESVNGVAIVDWLGDLVTGTPVTDVHCQQCQAP